MKINQDEIRRRFREFGLKVTPQRAAIYQSLVETTSHPTAEDLYRHVVSLHPMISRNTVYYTLGALARVGLVREVNVWRDRAQFDGNMTPHHHFICLKCRRIEDFEDGALDRLQPAPGRRRGFQVTGHRVEFHGYCGACSRGRKQAAKSKPHPHRSPKRRAV